MLGRKRATRRKKETTHGGVDCSRGREMRGERKRERYMEPRGVALQPARFAYLRSLFCMPSPPPSCLALLLLRSVPWNVLLFFLSSSSVRAGPPCSRCTVAFGLCIIIIVTTSSSWLVVVEESHLVSPFATATNPVNVVLSRQALLEPCPP